MLVVIGTDCKSSCESNYHMIMAMTAHVIMKTPINYDIQVLEAQNITWLEIVINLH